MFRLRHRFGIGLVFCALGAMHFLETYLAAILYLQLPGGIVISPGSIVLFSGKLAMLLLVYIREDAAAVRQPIYGLLVGNFLMVALVFTMRFHDLAPAVADRPLDLRLMDEMGGLMIWARILLFIDAILLILLYERMADWFGRRQLPRIVLSLALVLSFDQIGFFTALHLLAGVPMDVLCGRLDRQDGRGGGLRADGRLLPPLRRDGGGGQGHAPPRRRLRHPRPTASATRPRLTGPAATASPACSTASASTARAGAWSTTPCSASAR